MLTVGILKRGKAFFIERGIGEWKTKETQLISYQELAIDLIKRFREITFTHVPRIENRLADSPALMEFILSRSSTHASTPKHRVACHRHPSHREPFRRTGLIYLLGWRLSGVGTWWTITSQDEEDYEDDGNHGIILSTITSRRVHTGVRHSWSEESPEGTFPTICDLGRCPLQKVTRPSEIRSTHCWTSSFKWVRRTRQQPNACQENHEARPPIKSKGVKRCQKCKLLLFDGIFFQNAASCRMAGPSSIPKVRPRMKKTYLRRHDCCDQELLNIIENRRSEDLVEDKVKSEPTLGSDHSRREVFGCKGDGF